MKKNKTIKQRSLKTCECGHPRMLHLGIVKGDRNRSCDVNKCNCKEFIGKLKSPA